MFRELVAQAKVIIPKEAIGENIDVAYLSTWPPSQKPGKLYTFGATMRHYGLDHDDPTYMWRDATDFPVHPWREGLTVQQIYSKDYTTKQKDEADERVCKFVRDSGFKKAISAKQYSVSFLEAQSWLYDGKLVEVQNMLHRFSYHHIKTLKGGELIIWRKEDALMVIVGHPSLAGDSRVEIPLIKSQRRGASVSAISNFIKYLKGELAVEDDGSDEIRGYNDLAVWGTTVSEQILKSLHGPKIYSALAYRDSLLFNEIPPISALSTYEGHLSAGMDDDESDTSSETLNDVQPR